MTRTADIKLGAACNNRCVFCVQGGRRGMFPPRPFAEIEMRLKEGRGRGAQSLVLTGGEPALHGRFLETIREARRLGYADVQVQTNGRLFCYPDKCRETIEAGATAFSPALHGSNAPLHEYLTGVPGSFLQTVTGIRNLKKRGQTVLVNSVITKTNYRDLPELARLLMKFDADQLQLSFVHAAGSAEKNKEWLVPRYAMAEPCIKAAVNVCVQAGKAVMVEGVPYCCLKGCEAFIAEPVCPKTVVFDLEETAEDLGRSRAERGKIRDARCDDCVYSSSCEGPWREYPELFGWSEMEPVRHGRPLPPARRDAPYAFGKNGHILLKIGAACG